MKATTLTKLCRVFLPALIVTILFFEGCSSFPERFSTAQVNPDVPTSPNKQSDIEALRGITDLCSYAKPGFHWDREKRDANFLLYEFLNTGFPKETPLEETVIVFNRFAECDERSKTQPLLTADEVLAAIRDWDCTEEADKDDKKFCADVWKIAETGKMPKGSLLAYDRGMRGGTSIRGYKGYYVKTWEIILYLYLDKYRLDFKDVPQFSRTLRLKYISSGKDDETEK